MIFVIVDAYSGGSLYAKEILARGYPCVHVQSTADVPDFYRNSFRSQDFLENIVHSGDFEETLRRLSKYPVLWLIAGIESGVEVADQLSEKLKLNTSNGIRLSEARRDKFLMGEAIRNAGIQSVKQIRSRDLSQILEWVRAEGLSPVVVKPIKSAGTDRVSICRSEPEVINAVLALLGTRNKLGILNEDVLVQEFLEGTEYVVNSVSCQGRHVVSEFWQYTKINENGADCVYDIDELLPLTGELQHELSKYVARVLDALEIKWGPSHAEVMLTPRGPVLVEVAARVDGAANPSVSRECVGWSQIDLALDAYLDPATFFSRIKSERVLKKKSICIALISTEEGTIEALPGLTEIQRLPSFRYLNMKVKVGDRLHLTRNVFTIPGFVGLVHESREVIEDDYRKIRALEKTGMYLLS